MQMDSKTAYVLVNFNQILMVQNITKWPKWNEQIIVEPFSIPARPII